MGCNCGKRRRPPAPPKKPAGGKPNKISEEYTLTTRSGTLTFGSKLEADAANARTGYTGTVRPA